MTTRWIVRVCLPGEDDIELRFEHGEAIGEFLAETAKRGIDTYVTWLTPEVYTVSND